MIVRLSVRRDAYLAALCLAIVERTLILGVGWLAPFDAAAWLLGMLIRFMMLLLLAVSFGADVAKKPRLFHLAAVLILALLSVPAIITGETMPLLSAAFILAARGIRFERISRVCLLTAWGTLAMLLLVHLLGLTESYDMDFGYAVGRSMGMAHPNNFAAAAAVAVFLWAYERRKRPILPTAAGIALAAFVIYKITASRTVLVIQLTYCAALLLFALLRRTRARLLLRLIRFGFVPLLGCSLWMMLNSGSSLVAGLGDANFLSRFLSAFALYTENGVRLFGSYIQFRSLRTALQIGQPAVILDSAYLYLIVSQGLASTLIFTLFFARAMGRQARRGQLVLLMIAGMFMLSGMMERYMLDATMNFTLLSAFGALERDGVPGWKRM